MSRLVPITLTAAVLAAGAAGAADAATGHRAHRAKPPARLTARRLRPRPHAVAPGTTISSSQLIGDRVFANDEEGFALASDDQAQYPADTTDGGLTWRIDGPQVHVDAADAPEAVGYVGVANAHTFYAYGSEAIDVTSDGGRTWWETFVPGLAAAVVTNAQRRLVAYVQPGNGRTWQYVSTDSGRTWRYSTALGG